MPPFDSTDLPQDLAESLSKDFFIRFTTTGRRTGIPRTSETTFVWDKDGSFVVSGYPGKRDWIANMAADANVTLHTVEHGVYYDIPVKAEVITRREDRTGPLIAFLSRWASRPQATQKLFRLALGAIRVNHKLKLPWWGPFWAARKVLDRMPCARLVMVSFPTPRRGPPPQRSREV
jgi:hypothetical protein